MPPRASRFRCGIGPTPSTLANAQVENASLDWVANCLLFGKSTLTRLMYTRQTIADCKEMLLAYYHKGVRRNNAHNGTTVVLRVCVRMQVDQKRRCAVYLAKRYVQDSSTNRVDRAFLHNGRYFATRNQQKTPQFLV